MSSNLLRRGALILALVTGGLAGTVTLSVPASAETKTSSSAPVAARALGLGIDPLGDLAAETLGRLGAMGITDPLYVAGRDTIAAQVAFRVGVDPFQMQFAWAAADIDHQRALLAAHTQLGVPYRRNTSNPGVGFDCSGLTTFAWAAAGFDLVRQSGGQIRAAAPRTPETAMAGDLVYYPGHVSMWLGVDKAIIHASHPGRPVEVKVQSGNKSLRFGDPTG